MILETGELVTLDNVRRASWLAMLAGADFIKTSTGKVTPAATLPVTLVMLEAVRDFREAHGRQVGVKPAGGIRTAKDALRYLVLVNETAGGGLAGSPLVPLRRLQPAQRPAHAADQDDHRPLLRSRLLHLGLRGSGKRRQPHAACHTRLKRCRAPPQRGLAARARPEARTSSRLRLLKNLG